MKVAAPALLISALVLTACGSTVEERSATGGVSGAVIGGLVGGLGGALIGAAAGGVGGAITPVPADVAFRKGTEELSSVTPQSWKAPSEAATAAPTPIANTTRVPVSRATIREMQTSLKNEGLYRGRIDGIIGPRTRRAIADHQAKQGRGGGGELDDTTWRELTTTSNEPPQNEHEPQQPAPNPPPPQ